MNDIPPYAGIGREIFEQEGYRVIIHKTHLTNHKSENRECYCAEITGHDRRHRIFSDTAETARLDVLDWITSTQELDESGFFVETENQASTAEIPDIL